MEKYILQTTSQGEPIIVYSPDVQIDKDTYECIINLTIHPVDGIADDFIRTVTVRSTQNMNGFEVDAQREKAIQNFLTEINHG